MTSLMFSNYFITSEHLPPILDERAVGRATYLSWKQRQFLPSGSSDGQPSDEPLHDIVVGKDYLACDTDNNNFIAVMSKFTEISQSHYF